MEGDVWHVTLRDGRRLAYAEYGDPCGAPVFYFHGWPGSRLEAALAHQEAERHGLRIIAPDRPGFGQSDFQPGRRIGDWPVDVAQLADALGTERFAVIGVSGGGPYAAACAAKMPHRLTAATIACGLAPLEALSGSGAAAPRARLGLYMARMMPWAIWGLLTPLSWVVRHRPQSVVAWLVASAPPPDRRVLLEPRVGRVLTGSFRESYRQGARGAAWELVLFGRPWDFRVEDISIPVEVWYGDLDNIVPSSAGRWLAAALPRARATCCPAQAHFSLIVSQLPRIMAALRRGRTPPAWNE